MIIDFLRIVTEYIGIILCMHKVAGKRIKINWYSLVDFTGYMMTMFVLDNVSFGKIIVFAFWLAYTKIRVVDTWKQVIKPFVVTTCVIPILQLMIYTVIGIRMLKIIDVYSLVILINVLIIVIILAWKQKYLHALMNVVIKHRDIIFAILLILLFAYLVSYYLQYRMIESFFLDQLAICFLLVAIIFILWINSESEKKHKAEELRTYQLYTKTFEDAVTAIRMKQHEFDNHINAIKCMRLTIQDTEELFDEQDKYCDKVLQDNKYNKLLKLNMSPILIGFLYSKFTATSVYDINIAYDIQDVNIENIEINDLIEIIGILFDNAVDALKEQGDIEMEVKLSKTENKFMVSVANIGSWRTNSEIEKFFQYGYSTKGENHGIGLYRVTTLLKKYKANIQAENIVIHEMNYICFKVIFYI